MAEIQLLKRMAEDISFLKQKVIHIEEELTDISNYLHIVRPEYVEKLKKIDQGKFLSREEFEKELGE